MNQAALSPLKQAFLALQDAQARVVALEAEKTEPIAIIGQGCRMPGQAEGSQKESLEIFWDLLSAGSDAVSDRLRHRWREMGVDTDKVPERANYAALLDAPEQFDAAFFGISPREASSMDPQQRYLLETCWEALEHAGIPPDSVYGAPVGVYFGICTSDYSLLRLATTPLAELDAHFGSGTAHSIASGRISYLLGLRGPSLSIDTACSSSLVAVHLASEALRRGECRLALAGGVNLIVSTEASRTFVQAGMLSPDGRCKSFAASADGYVRGEGCGVVILKRLRDAVADGDRVLAVIRGSAVNHDGPSSGLTVPNGLAQQALMRRALQAAGVAPGEVGYIEAHGTGTSLGDPIEAEALGAVMGAGRPADRPLLIGSVKTNIGHLEAAAGVAGLIKVVLALGHEELPAQLHFDAPSPHIRWDALHLQVVDRLRPWEPIGGRRIAGVSSFGFSGTNAHIVVEAAPVSAPAEGLRRPVEILPIGAKTESALRLLAARYVDRLEHLSAEAWPDLCHTAAVGRAHFAHRLSVRGADPQTARAALQAFLAGQPHLALVVGATPAGRPRVAFLFTGQGSQYSGMGRALAAGSPSFRHILERADAVLADRLDIPLGSLLRGENPDAAALLNQTLYTQPALYVLEYALAELWRSLGVVPAAMLGHSLGEYVACAVAGVFDFENGLRLVADRARLMHGVTADGAILVVAASEADVSELLAGHAADVSLAGVNAARQVSVSGARAAVEAIAAQCAARGWRTHALPVSQAFHSPLMQSIAAAFEARASELAYAPPRLPVISNLTGALLPTASAAYWRAHMREPVRFAQGLETLAALGCDMLIELGPKPVLIQLARQAGQQAKPRRYATSLKGPDIDAWDALCQAVQELYAAGAELDWAGWNRDYKRRKIDAPTTPFERRRHWITPSVAKPVPSQRRPGGHPLLGTRLRSALEGGQFEAGLAAAGETAWLADHRIRGQVILPATGLIEIMLAAGQAIDPDLRALEELSIRAPLGFPAEGARTVQTVVDRVQDARARVRVFAAEADIAGVEEPPDVQGQQRFRLLAEAWLTPAAAPTSATVDLAAIQVRCLRRTDAAEHYRRIAERGADFGPAFRGVQLLWGGDNEAIAEIRSELTPVDPARPHPAALDACLQAAAAAMPDTGETFMPVALNRFELFTSHWPAHLVVHVRVTRPDPLAPEIDVTVHDAAGNPLAGLVGLRFQNVSTSSKPDDLPSWLYELSWRETPPGVAAADTSTAWIVVGFGTLATAAATALRAAGRTAMLCAPVAAQLDQALAGNGGPWGIVYAPPDLEGDPSENGPGSAQPGVEQLLVLSHLHAHQGLLANARLYVVTRKVHAVRADEATLLTDAPISGLAATLFTEFPELRCTRIDVDPADPAQAGADIAGEMLADTAEDWVAYRDAHRFAARLQWSQDIRPVGVDESGPIRLASSQGLDGLEWRPAPIRELGPRDIEIEVHAAPLNFRDVVTVVGLVSDQMELGGECAGVVTRVGEAVTRFEPGDAVVALAPGSFASRVIAAEDLTIAKPAALTFETAAAQGMVYLTADHCLNAVARMQPGERVLIHAAAGGVGLAAVQLCRRAGVEIYATAGSDPKRAYLQKLGVNHVLDSRSLSFAAEIRRLTGGRGVDIVLNSLAGGFVDAGLSLLKPGGRFVEIGKTDLRSEAAVDATHPGIRYTAVDLTDNMREQPTNLMARLRTLFDDMQAGTLQPIPHKIFSFAEARAAFRDLASARHIGKLVLAPTPPSPLVRKEGAYIVTGGLTGLGWRVAEFLAEQGAGRVLLLGRRPPTPRVAARIAHWSGAGVDMTAIEGDVGAFVTVRDAVAAAGPALRGVIHCANVLDDAPVGELTWDRFAKVMHPKAEGAWHLHRATEGATLDFFVLFSSWASLAGARGGANYASANVALDSLAHLRRHLGKPALSIDWGIWSEIGWASLLPGGVPMRPGFSTITPTQGIRALQLAMRAAGTAQLAIAPIDWPTLLRVSGGNVASVWLEVLQSQGVRPNRYNGPALPSLVEVIGGAAPNEVHATVVEHLQVMAAKALGVDEPGRINPDHPLQEIGLDSILAVDLRNTLARSLNAAMPATLLFDYPTLNSLATYSIGLVSPPAPKAFIDRPDEEQSLLALIEGLSDDEVDERLLSRGAEIAS